MALSEKLPKQWRKSPSAKCSLLTPVLTKKIKNEDTKYHDISKSGPLKTWESHFHTIWIIELTLISRCFGKGKVFSKTLT